MFVEDKIIIGAGLYGLYAALFFARKNASQKIMVIEHDSSAFSRATLVNQARVHMGYHYPRSLSTADKTAHYFRRFKEDFAFCISSKFDQIYATSSKFSWTNANQFARFCQNAGIRCDAINPDRYFYNDMCDGAFLTEEYTYDAILLRDYFLKEIDKHQNIQLSYNAKIDSIVKNEDHFTISFADGTEVASGFVLNASYASVNQVSSLLGYESLKIKYELCEIILCDPGEKLKPIGLTVMDGPFFSIMPFGKTGYHSLTSVTFTPHVTSYDDLPTFSCQNKRTDKMCSPRQLCNCNVCDAKPDSAWPYMSGLTRKYVLPELDFTFRESLYSMKPILRASEIDDSRPTVIRKYSDNPTYYAVLSGKINTVYDLEEVLADE